MIALDTNVLVRYFTEDDSRQFTLAADLIESQLTSSDPGFVSLVTLCETIWVMEDVYGLAPDRIAKVVSFLLESDSIEIEQHQIVAAAVAHSHRDLADIVIHLIGQANGCTHTVTFDKRFARLDGVELLKA